MLVALLTREKCRPRTNRGNRNEVRGVTEFDVNSDLTNCCALAILKIAKNKKDDFGCVV
jgi:hypothetical protein